MVSRAIDRARPAVYRWLPYVLTIAMATFGAWLAARSVVSETATVAYYNAVDACRRGNLVLAPAHDFFVTLASDHGNNDSAVRNAAEVAAIHTAPRDCTAVVRRIGPADPYVPPAKR